MCNYELAGDRRIADIKIVRGCRSAQFEGERRLELSCASERVLDNQDRSLIEPGLLELAAAIAMHYAERPTIVMKRPIQKLGVSEADGLKPLHCGPQEQVPSVGFRPLDDDFG